MKKIFIIVIGFSLFTAACQNNKNQTTADSPQAVGQNLEPEEDYSLIGKKGLLIYPEFKAEVTYLNDSTLHWKTTTPNGQVNEETEEVFLKKLSPHQYFLNWIEQDGLTISQIIDLKSKTVTAFGTFSDETSKRGKRSGTMFEGSFEFVE